MKKLFLILAALFVFVNTQAQTPMTGTDTVTNAGTVNLVSAISGDYQTISFQLVATKVDGTPAGTVKIQASNDGTNYITINTYGITANYTDTFTITNVATQTYFWVENPGKYKYYRLNCVGSGTSNYIVRGYALGRTH